MSREIKVWDIWVRLFHWLLVLLILFNWLSAELGDVWMEWHIRAGFLTAGLVVFRLIWGLWGSWSARFSAFVKAPKQILRYIQGEDNTHYLSHNPLGGIGVVALLGLILAQVITGLFSNDDILIEGPFASLISYDASLLMTDVHEAIFNLLMIVIVIHLAGVLFHQTIRREPLIQAMIHGRKPLNPTDKGQDRPLKVPFFALVLALGGGVTLTYWLFQF